MPDQAHEQSVWRRATPAQQGIWILDRIERLRPAYLIPSVLEFSGAVDHVLLVSAVQKALGRQPVLRSVFRLNIRRRQVEYHTDASPQLITSAGLPTGSWVSEDLDRRVLDRLGNPTGFAYTDPDGRAGSPKPLGRVASVWSTYCTRRPIRQRKLGLPK